MPDEPLTVAEWRANPKKQRQLREALALPILKEAFATLKALARPHVAGTNTIESIAIHAAHVAGKHDMVKDLHALSKKYEKPEPQKDSHTNLTPEEVDELTRNQTEE